MSLKKKIALSFFISAFIIALLIAFEYFNFIAIKKEIRYLKNMDTLRSKSLQLKSLETRFLIFGFPKSYNESLAVHQHINELNTIVLESMRKDQAASLSHLQEYIKEYERKFGRLEELVASFADDLQQIKPSYKKYDKLSPLLESFFSEQAEDNTAFFERVFMLSPNERLANQFRELEAEISSLRKTGDDILLLTGNLDRGARENVERFIRNSQTAILVFFPLFFIIGIGLLFCITSNIVKRLKVFIGIVESAGKGSFPQKSTELLRLGGNDEVGILAQKFNAMERQIAEREEDLNRKSKELLQSKKLAAIGTLASGVAHELNNPLNNIYISAQILVQEAADHAASPLIKETVHDIIGQTTRVKSLVSDLLDFARGREPQFRAVELNELMRSVYRSVSSMMNPETVRFVLEGFQADIVISADPEQLERVFINLFGNALDAMSRQHKPAQGSREAPDPDGVLTVRIKSGEDAVTIQVSDTGAGMKQETIDRIFEPFFTTKEKGTGLGLAIVFNIIKKHKGEISVESKEGRGTAFTITLPRVHTAAPGGIVREMSATVLDSVRRSTAGKYL